jgi:hypothetical protein
MRLNTPCKPLPKKVKSSLPLDGFVTDARIDELAAGA